MVLLRYLIVKLEYYFFLLLEGEIVLVIMLIVNILDRLVDFVVIYFGNYEWVFLVFLIVRKG